MNDPGSLLQRLNVVYVDDDEEMWALLERSFRRRLKGVHYGRNGIEGLELIERVAPDLVVTDLQMPVMDGLAMIRALRSGRHAGLPVIVVTAHSDEAHHTSLADAFIYKPLDIRKLFALMEELMAGR